ncbi:hypothetical protein MARPO_0023s0083 [Marchantia polymorpha]|uniref:Uncharacterized protein n=1 Tax=Marchantia polymorpha TaxID=3197 RepID=A0A2R6XCC9_MARPO|nr:hypothetical protein MARPO_0023s0083 [Marchantia polymorpha]|eukprot:PTQ43767.1 hypothetical protein MARPO_0023s0083 [Marchantia polymorpha]
MPSGQEICLSEPGVRTESCLRLRTRNSSYKGGKFVRPVKQVILDRLSPVAGSHSPDQLAPFFVQQVSGTIVEIPLLPPTSDRPLSTECHRAAAILRCTGP